MTTDVASLRADLLEARRSRDAHATRAIGSLLTAIANAEAVPVADEPYRVVEGSGDVPRRELTEADIAGLLEAEIEERGRAIDEYRRVDADSSSLEAEIAVLERFRAEVE